ncbi:MAG: cation:proton antiporter [Bdellovibrionaceae bacterium]|nr:cation:proton antiporter [Pseudobdellovibrionaceae bacterium]
MYLITSLLILLAVSRLLGRLFESLGYLAIIGEIFAGFLLGPAVFNFINPEITGLNGIVELGIFLLIFSAGLEIELKDFLQSLKSKAILCGLISFIVPFSVGLLFGSLFKLDFFGSIVIGLCFAVTAIPVALKFLKSTKLINSKVGHGVMATAVVIEILALLVLGFTSESSANDSLFEYLKMILIKGGEMLLFFFLVMAVNKIFRSELRYIQRTQKAFKYLVEALGEEAVFGLGLVFVLIFSTLSEFLGFHFIIGAFFGGLLLNKDIIGTNFFDSLSLTLRSITTQFFTPIFFAYLGLIIQRSAFQDISFIIALIIVGYGTKILSASLGAKLSGFSKSDSLKMGLILNSRGTFDLIVANLSLAKGYIDSKIFSLLVLFGVFSVVFNPILYRRFYHQKEST